MGPLVYVETPEGLVRPRRRHQEPYRSVDEAHQSQTVRDLLRNRLPEASRDESLDAGSECRGDHSMAPTDEER